MRGGWGGDGWGWLRVWCAHIYPMDAVFDTPDDVPEEVGGRGGSKAVGGGGARRDGVSKEGSGRPGRGAKHDSARRPAARRAGKAGAGGQLGQPR